MSNLAQTFRRGGSSAHSAVQSGPPKNEFKFVPKDYLKEDGDRAFIRILDLSTNNLIGVKTRSWKTPGTGKGLGKNFNNEVHEKMVRFGGEEDAEKEITLKENDLSGILVSGVKEEKEGNSTHIVPFQDEELTEQRFNTNYRFPMVLEKVITAKGVVTEYDKPVFWEANWTMFTGSIMGLPKKPSNQDDYSFGEESHTPEYTVMVTRGTQNGFPNYDVSGVKRYQNEKGKWVDDDGYMVPLEELYDEAALDALYEALEPVLKSMEDDFMDENAVKREVARACGGAKKSVTNLDAKQTLQMNDDPVSDDDKAPFAEDEPQKEAETTPPTTGGGFARRTRTKVA